VFAQEGARTAVLARGKAGLDEAVAALTALGAPDTVGLAADLTDRAQVDAAFASVGERWGGLNVLVNAAGPVDVGIGRFDDLDDAEWEATFDIGTLSAIRCVRAALPLLRGAPWARIVNISAHSTRRQSPELVAYTASKAALTSVSKNLSLALAPAGILVNTVSPGSILSAGLKGYLRALPPERHADPGDLRDAMRIIAEDFGHPAHLGRAGEPSEVGRVVAFIGSPANSYMTGADLNVDGGSDF
jgi:NAD(P)-dependent dehydrogenase (short-subunit alcohol dehydrogenase family)